MWEFCKYEIKYRLKHISTYVFTLVLMGLAVLLNLAAGGAIAGSAVNIGGVGDKVAINSPFMIYVFSIAINIFSIFIMAALVNHMFSKDLENKFYPILFTKPIKKYQYIIGRFLGNLIIMMSIFCAVMITMALSALIPGIEKDMVLMPKLSWYVNPLFVMALPNFYFIGAFFIASVIATKKPSSVFGIGFLLFAVFSFAGLITSKVDSKTLAALIDPFGQKAFELSVNSWTSAEMNTLQVGLTEQMLLNRIFWILISTVILLFAWKKFNFEFSYKSKNEKKLVDYIEVQDSKVKEIPIVKFKESFKTNFMQFLSFFKYNMKLVFKSPAIYYASILGLLFMVVAIAESNTIFGTRILPVTYHVAGVVYGSFMIFFLLIITFFSGELIWSSRDNKFNLIEDTMPFKSFNNFFSKFLTMAFIIAVYVLFMIITGVIYQFFSGYTNFELGVYFKILYIQYYPRYLMLLCFSFFLHNLVNHKYASHFIFVLFVMGKNFLMQFNIEHHLLIPFSTPTATYSDMSGFGPNVTSTFWFTIYWLLMSIILLSITVLSWKRGFQLRFIRDILNKLKAKNVIIINSLIVFVTLLTAGYIFYNTNIINTFETSKQSEKSQVSYEKAYSHFYKKNQPKIQDIVLNVDIFPEQREMSSTGRFMMKNIGETPIDSVMIHYYNETELNELLLSKTAQLIVDDKDLGLKLFKFDTPLNPNDSLYLDFSLTYTRKGFKNSGTNHEILKNGSFLHNHYFPSIGYSKRFELTNERKRKKYGLPKQDMMPETTDSWGLTQNYICGDADWVSYKATVSTSSDQIALSPGELVAQWKEGNRNYYTYQIKENMINFFTVLSAEYKVKKDKWNDIDLEIYYHNNHTYNLESMMLGLKESLKYYTREFGEYPYSVLRIAEFPRYGYYAQAFPTLIPFSEGIGFIANVKPNTIDYPYYVTAHETGHQWWAHQVIGGNTRGTIMLSESFTEYSSLMVVKHRFGDYLYRQQLKYALYDYLSGRSGESRYELPLTQVETQSYIYYNKGMLVMNAASRLLGEKQLNSALSEFVKLTKFKANPYTNTQEFMSVLDDYVPDSLKVKIDEMFNQIVLYDYNLKKAEVEELENSKYKIKIEFSAEKQLYDAKGNPQKIDLAEWVEIGFLIKDRLGKKKTDKIIGTERVYITQKDNIIEFITETKPEEVIIDPYFLSLDKILHNNKVSIK